MKNHIKVNGRILQTNKTWRHLTYSQREWIAKITYEEHVRFVREHGILPMKKKKDIVIDRVLSRIDERQIWIPSHAVKPHISKYIDRANRKSPLFES